MRKVQRQWCRADQSSRHVPTWEFSILIFFNLTSCMSRRISNHSKVSLYTSHSEKRPASSLKVLHGQTSSTWERWFTEPWSALMLHSLWKSLLQCLWLKLQVIMLRSRKRCARLTSNNTAKRSKTCARFQMLFITLISITELSLKPAQYYQLSRHPRICNLTLPPPLSFHQRQLLPVSLLSFRRPGENGDASSKQGKSTKSKALLSTKSQ